ncbi:MAG: type II toxin-antitoxin system HicB family antitoxin [Gemmataceae bacterium]|nr:type II toxin-antitoxin system HicB family antitoxin [Gemmataceae bacterium]
MTEILENAQSNATIQPRVWKATPRAYRVYVVTSKDDDGTVSAIAESLPGAVGCGNTEPEALKSLAEAVKGVIETYQADGQEIPWKNSREVSGKGKWITVHVEDTANIG